MKKFPAVIILFLVFTCIAAGATLYPEPGIPVLAAPEIGAKAIALTAGNAEYEVVAVQRYMFRQHPFGRYFDFSKVKLVGGQYGWICEELRLVDRNGKKAIDRIPPDNFNYKAAAVICGLIILVLAFYFIGEKLFPQQLLQLGLKRISPAEQTAGLLALLVLTRYLQLLIMLSCDSSLVTLSPDGNTYFNMARDIVNLNFSNPWDRSVGTCFVYIPFVWLFPAAKSFLDVAPQLSVFNGFVLMPLCFVMGFLIIRKVCGSEFKAFFAVLLWIIIPFFYFNVQDFDKEVFGSLIGLPQFHFSWRLYSLHQALSYNNLIDTSSTFFVFSTIALALFMPPRWQLVAVVSALFGVTCLIRLNNIFFAPLLAFIFWYRLNSCWKTWPQILRYIAGGLICFLLAFGVQFVFNKLHVGSFLTFPYVLCGNGTERGFVLAMLPMHTKFLIGCNFLFFVLGVWGMIFCKDKYCRNFLILMAAPTAIFFCGHISTTTDPVRFILSVFLPLAAAFVYAGPWKELNRTQVSCLAAIFAVSAFFYQPLYFKWIVLPSQAPGEYIGGIMALVLSAGILSYFIRDRKFALYAGVFMLLYYLNSPWLLLAALVILTAFAVFDFVLLEVKPGIRRIIADSSDVCRNKLSR
ncbi:MAG: hypothetical protein WCV67_09225 [Victivallaceae bacterium]|jgi:hypothetical protein